MTSWTRMRNSRSEVLLIYGSFVGDFGWVLWCCCYHIRKWRQYPQIDLSIYIYIITYMYDRCYSQSCKVIKVQRLTLEAPEYTYIYIWTIVNPFRPVCFWFADKKSGKRTNYKWGKKNLFFVFVSITSIAYTRIDSWIIF